MSDYLSNLDPANLANVVRQLAIDVAELKGRTVNVNSLEELTNDLGLQQSGEFRSGNGAEPGDGFTGGRFGYPGFEYAGKTWFLVGVKNDVLMAGMDLETGAIYGAGGELLIDSEGLTIAGLRAGINIESGAGVTKRNFLMEMLVTRGSYITTSVGALSFADGDGAESISNGGFELGDLTNWTPSTPEKWSVEIDEPFEGDYYVKCALGVADSDELVSDQYAATAGVPYHFTGASNVDGIWGKANVNVCWYDAAAGGNLISSDYVKFYPASTNRSLDWIPFSGYCVAPVGALGMKVVLSPSTGGVLPEVNIFYDSISVRPCTILRRLMLAPEAEFFNGTNYRRLLSGRKQLHTPRPPITALVVTGTGNVDWGAHTYKVTFVDASGETIGSAASNSVTNNTSNRQTTVIISTGPAGTTSRKIYRTAAGGATYLLLATVANNTTVSYTDNIADAELGAALPAENLSESNFLFPTSHQVFGTGFVKSPSATYAWNTSDNFYFQGAAYDGTHANFDTYKTGFMLKVGTYTLRMYYAKNSACGKADMYLDGTALTTALDFYSGGTVAIYTNTSVVVDEDGWHELELVVNGKNASSSGYQLRISLVEMIRTGD